MINRGMTVREIAVQMPQATRVLEKLKIDYCCGGLRPLTDACGSAGLNVDEVIGMLEAENESGAQETDSADFQKFSLSELIDYIVSTHHVFTKQEMARLAVLTTKVISAHGTNHPELHKVGALVDQLCADLNPHMFKEEQVLFPYILSLASASEAKRRAPFAPFGTVNNPVRMMMKEHDIAGEILRELRTVTADYTIPHDACISYRTLYEALEAFENDLHQHIHLENNILFPRSVTLETELRALTGSGV